MIPKKRGPSAGGAALAAVTLVLTAALALGVWAAAAKESDVLAVRAGTIETVTRGIVEGGTVLIRNGTIEAVGRGLALPEGARVMDAGRDAVILPGFIDGLTDLGADEGAFGSDADEATSPVAPQLRIIDAINPENDFLPRARSRGVTAALVAPGLGNLISGQSALLRLAGPSPEAMIVRFPAALQLSLGEAPKHRIGAKGQAPQTRMGEAALVRKWLVEAREYQQSIEDYNRKVKELEAKPGTGERPVKPEVKSAYLPLVEALAGRLPVMIHAERLDDILTALRLAEEFKLRLILSGGAEAYKVKDRLAAQKIPVVLKPDEASRLSVETQGAVYDNAAILEKSGISIAFHTGSIGKGTSLLDQARLAVAYGLPASAALKALTSGAAEIFGAGAEMGAIEKGKSADLVIWNADPLAGPARVKQVIIRGRAVSLD